MNLFQIVDGNGDLETHDAADKFENLTINTDPIAEDSKVGQDISGRNGFQEDLVGGEGQFFWEDGGGKTFWED